MENRKILITGILSFFWISLFAYFIVKNTLLSNPNKFNYYLVNIPDVEPMELKFNVEEGHYNVIFKNKIIKDPDILWWDDILLKFKKKENILEISILQYEIRCEENEWVSLEPIPRFPIIAEIPEKAIFLPIRNMEPNRFMVKFTGEKFIIWDKVRNTHDTIENNRDTLYNIPFMLQYLKLDKKIRLSFSAPLRLLNVPFTNKTTIIGNYEIFYNYNFLFPSTIIPYDFYSEVRELCLKGVIFYDNRDRSLKIKIPSDKNLRRIFDKVFEIKNNVIIWRRFKKYLSTERDKKSKFYGKFDGKFLTPWVIRNNRVYGLKTYYLSQNISISKLLRQNNLSVLRDRNGDFLFRKNTPVLNSLWNIFPPEILNSLLDEYVMSKDFVSQMKYYFTKEKEKTLYLSIDLKLQRLLEEVIKEFAENTNEGAKNYYRRIYNSPFPRIGAVILSEDGEILSAVSYPYPKSLNEFLFFANKIPGELRWHNSPLANRVWKEIYPIGSTVKPLIAVMALNSGIYIRRWNKYYIPKAGSKEEIFIDYRGYIEGIRGHEIKPLKNYKNYRYPFEITFRDFLIQSINVASAQLLCSFSPPLLRRFASYWDKENIFLLKENLKKIGSFGNPKFLNPFWANGSEILDYNENDFTRISRFSIGDGIQSSLLYLTSIFLSIDNNKLIVPSLQKGGGKILLSPLFERDYSSLIRRYLEEVVRNEKGTAYKVFKNFIERHNDIRIWGKTGTAEVLNRRSHKLFVCGFELYNKKYYMAVIVENSENLYRYNPAAMIVKNFLEKFLNSKVKRNEN